MELAVTFISAILAISGAYLAGRWQSQLEYKKWIRSREDDLAKEARLAVADFTRKVSTATHEIVWLASRAKSFSYEITQQDRSMYNEEIHKLIPEIVGSLAIISALDKNLYSRMNQIALQFYSLDGQMDNLLNSHQTDKKKLDSLHLAAYNFNRELTEKVSGVFVEIYQPKSS